MGAEVLIIVLIVVLLFGGSLLPKLARSIREARDELRADSDDDERHERR